MSITTITLPNGAVVESTAPVAELASLMQAAPAAQQTPQNGAQFRAQFGTVSVEETNSTGRKPRKPRQTQPAAPKVPVPAKRARKARKEGAGSAKDKLAEVRRLSASGDHEAALALCPMSWVQERTAITKRLTAGTEVVAPVEAPPAARKGRKAPKAPTQEALKPSEMARRANRHKLDCSCGMCVKLGYVTQPQPGCDAPNEPTSTVKAKSARKGRKSDKVLTAQGPAKRTTAKAVAEKVDKANAQEADAQDAVSTSVIAPTAGERLLKAIMDKAEKVIATGDREAMAEEYCTAITNVETLDDMAEQAAQEGNAGQATALRTKAAAFAEAANALMVAEAY